MLVDNITITLKSGNGGRGSTKVKYKHATGGDGGRGGDIYLKGTENEYDLSYFRGNTEFEAENGDPGLEGDKQGKNATDKYVLVPLGTAVYSDGVLLGTLTEHNQELLIAKGKKGSIGNITQKKHPRRVVFTQEEMTGDTIEVTLDLRLHADILFIGYPNAGKSSMLNQLTKAHAKVAAYPFTTLEPQLGRMGDIVLMDLPGLIDGTHVGKGLGTNFVKHTESSILTAHFISLENDDPVATYKTLRSEIGQISEALYNKKEIVILSKKDEASPEKIAESIKQFKKLKITPIIASVLEDDTVETVRDAFTKEIAALRKLRADAEAKAEEEKMTFSLPTEEV